MEKNETHISVVFLVADKVFKLKRSIKYSYLDFSTLELRRRHCEAEVAINPRTPPDLYKGVVAVRRDEAENFYIGGAGEVAEWLVEMARFDEDTLFDHMGQAGKLLPPLTGDLAEAIARFHMRAEAMFEEARNSHGLAITEKASPGDAGSAALVRRVGREDELTAAKGRLADLIVASRPTEESGATLTMTINAALFETGRPVLIAPPKTLQTIGKKIAILWNGSAEASRAVAAAMPLITRCDRVIVMTLENDKTSSEVAPELATYFAWHGVSAETRTLPSRLQVGEVLLEDCTVVGADMLVMGAYTHSRMRQLILGGVTKHVLANAQLPVLMAH